MLKRNDLKPNLASFQKFLLQHCWHGPQEGEWGGGQMNMGGGDRTAGIGESERKRD